MTRQVHGERLPILLPTSLFAVILAIGTALTAAHPAHAAFAYLKDDAGISYTADDADPTAGAAVNDYDPGVGGTDVTIPASVTINGIVYPVTSIHDGAFYNNGLTSVVIPDSVTSIGAAAFSTNAIESVTIPDSVTSIGGSVFYGNDLTSVVIPDSITSIPASAFAENDLETLTIPDSVTTIAMGAFAANHLTSVSIPDSVITIGDYAFYQNGLTNVTIPGSVGSIGEYAFFGSPLGSVTFLGDAPTIVPTTANGSFGEAAGKTLYFLSTATGFTTPTWQGYSTEAIPVTHTVTFHTGGGTPVDPMTVNDGDTLTPPADPTLEGHSFTGWYTAEATTPYDLEIPVTGDLVLYAGWMINSYTVTFDTGDGTPVPPVNVDHGEALSPPADPTLEGHSFTGWYTDASATTPYDLDTPVTGDLTLYAGWQAAVIGEGEGGGLPITGGANLSGPLLTGLLLLTAGVGALLRRRRSGASPGMAP